MATVRLRLLPRMRRPPSVRLSVRSLNEGGVRYANDSASAYWSFTPQVQEWLFVPLVSK